MTAQRLEETLFTCWSKGGEEEPPLLTNEVLLESVVNRDNISYYQWFLEHYANKIDVQEYQLLYRRGLIEHISLARDMVSAVDSYQLSQHVYQSSLEGSNILDYTGWLLEEGYVTSSLSWILASHVRKLLRNDSPRAWELLQSLLQCILLSNPTHQEFQIGALLTVSQTERSVRLLRLISSVGLFSTDIGRNAFVTLNESEAALISPYIPPSDTHHNVRLVFDMIRRDSSCQGGRMPVKEYASFIGRFSAEITPYLMSLLSFLLGVTTEPMNPLLEHSHFMQNLARDLLEGPVTASLFSSPRLVRRLTEIVACHGHSTTLYAVHIRVTNFSSPVIRQSYFKALNSALSHIATYSVSVDGERMRMAVGRYRYVMELLEHNLNLDRWGHAEVLDNEYAYLTIGPLIDEINFQVFQARNRSTLLKYLSYADRWLSILVKNSKIYTLHQDRVFIIEHQELVGVRTLIRIIESAMFLSSAVADTFRIRLKIFITENPELYLKAIISRFLTLDRLGLVVSSAILQEFTLPGVSYTQITLALGDRIYTREGNQLREVIDLPEVTCQTCRKPVSDKIFVSAEDSHGVFYCEECVSKSATRVTCVVCMSNDEDLEMKIAPCKHTFCSECMVQLIFCPLCRRSLATLQTREVSPDEAIRTFLEYLRLL